MRRVNLKGAAFLFVFLAACGGGGGDGGGGPQSQPATQPQQSQSGNQPNDATARYVAIDLHPSAYVFTDGWGIGDGEQAGQSDFSNTRPGVTHALLWRGSALSVVDLNPNGFINSVAYATSGGVQAGFGTTTSGARHALKWFGLAASVVDLDPGGTTGSEAHGIAGDRVVGFRMTGLDINHAMLWTTSGPIDLHPTSGFTSSAANGTDGTQQVGSGSNPNGGMGAITHALLWSGSAASVVDLHPATGFSISAAFAVSGGQQVGEGFIGSNAHALLWTGSAQSVVDLNPSGFFDSHALGVAGGRQVGYGVMSGTGATHALLWNGTAASVVDLHTFLPPGFATSRANAIDASGNIIGTADGHAILWVRQR